jgi:hypothetical protein
VQGATQEKIGLGETPLLLFNCCAQGCDRRLELPSPIVVLGLFEILLCEMARHRSYLLTGSPRGAHCELTSFAKVKEDGSPALKPTEERSG